MKLAYWVVSNKSWQLKNDLGQTMYTIKSDSNGFVFAFGNYKIKNYRHLKDAKQYCEQQARSDGYRVLTEAETNLL